MSSPPNNTQLQQQIEDLQSRLAYQEDLLQSLNEIVAQQNGTIDHLQQQLQHYRSRLEAVSFSIESKVIEKPPHY